MHGVFRVVGEREGKREGPDVLRLRIVFCGVLGGEWWWMGDEERGQSERVLSCGLHGMEVKQQWK